MNERIKILEKQLNTLQKELESVEIKPEYAHYCTLIKKKMSINEELNNIRWSILSNEEKEAKRNEDILLTEKYYNKYKENKANLLYKKKYSELLVFLKNKNHIYLNLLYYFFNISLYIDITNPYLKTTIENLFKIENPDVSEFLHKYNELLSLKKAK
ncbi:hypothetical protein ACI76O_11700 [Capnocytophaga cynodegmi]|uniref:hypothetical protein n=1 Tax=Capnocytophaga cynodegmi TaxID=28189 RepID=UPI00385D0E09